MNILNKKLRFAVGYSLNNKDAYNRFLCPIEFYVGRWSNAKNRHALLFTEIAREHNKNELFIKQTGEIKAQDVVLHYGISLNN